MSQNPPSVQLSARIYRLLLLLYPRSFRRDFGAEMMRLFVDISGSAVDHRGSIGLAIVWFRILVDTVSAAPRERLAEAQRIFCGSRQRLLDLHWQTALLASLLVGIVLTPADLASMLVLGIPLFGAYVCTARSAPLPGSLRSVFVSVSALPLIIAIALLTRPLQVQRISENLTGWSPIMLFMVLPLTVTVFAIATTLIAVRMWTGKARVHTINRMSRSSPCLETLH